MSEFGVPHGPRCTLPPLNIEQRMAEGGHSTNIQGKDSEQSLVVNNTPQATTDSGSTTVQTPPATSSSSSEGARVLTNEEVEAELHKKCQALQLKLQEAEAKARQKTQENIYLLTDQSRILQARLDQVNAAAAATQNTLPVNSSASAPPVASTAGLFSSTNPLAPPTTTAGISASPFSQSAPRIAPANSTTASSSIATSQFIHGNSQASFSTGTTSSSSVIAQGGIPALGQSAATYQTAPGFGQSAPALHSSWPSLGIAPQGQMAGASNYQTIWQNTPNMANQQGNSTSLPDIQAALLASNPQILSNLNVKPDDIIKMNSIARAMAGMPVQDTMQKDEATVLGKYIPELFAIRYGKIEDIRARMTFHEFMAMYVRMLVTMLKDDPALLPDRLTLLNAITSKAARHRWPAVRNAYISAMHQMKHGRRQWADDLSGVFADHLDTHTMVRMDNPPSASGQSHQQKSRFPCRDWNEKSCHRNNCKFSHECSSCRQEHPLKYCPNAGNFAGPPPN